MNPYQTIIVEKDDTVVTVTLNRPERRNGITEQMDVELEAAFAEIVDDDGLRAIIVTGAGTAFCSGGDLDQKVGVATETADPLFVKRRLSRSTRLVEVIMCVPKPVIAAVNGAAVGAGCNLALACDIILASETARFGQLYLLRGLGIDWGGSWTLPRMIGLHRAKEFAFSPDLIDAHQAAELGLVNRVVPADRLLDEAKALAARYAANAPLALASTKEALNRSFGVSLPEALAGEAQSSALLWTTHDGREGIRAFIERRPPDWKNR